MTVGWLPLVASILLLQVDFIKSENSTKLLFLQILFRHGDRTPTWHYPNDPNPVDVWPEGLQKLTLLGKRQHYVLGKFLRSMYSNFITSSPNEIIVNSTNVDRCLRSAMANLMSFYAPNSEWKFEENLNWQPIPIFYLPKEIDKYLHPGSTCPRADVELKRIFEENKGIFSEYQTKLKTVTVNSEISTKNFLTYLLLYDTLLIEKKHNLTIPTWMDSYWNELKEFSDLIFFSVYNSTLHQRLRAGPFLQRVIENMNNKVSGALPQLKVQIFSAHDANLVVVLEALKLFNMRRPPYCATLIFELHEGQDGQKLVRMLYLNSTTPENGNQKPHLLKLDGCYEFCPLTYFVNFTKHLIPDNWEEECKIDQSPTSSANSLISGYFGIYLIALKVSLWAALRLSLTCNF